MSPAIAAAIGISTAATRWLLASKPVGAIGATVTIPQDIAWRIFTKGIARENAREHVGVTGDAALGDHVLDMLAIVG